MSEPSKIVVSFDISSLSAIRGLTLAIEGFAKAVADANMPYTALGTVELTNDRADQDEELHRKAQETLNLTADRDAFRCVHCNQLRSEHVGANFICRNQQLSLNPATFTPKES